MHLLRCSHCQSAVFFENESCNNCGSLLGFVPARLQMQAYDPASVTLGDANAAAGTGAEAQPAAWTPLSPDAGAALRPCANRVTHGICNWMLDEGDPSLLCRSCRLTRIVPLLTQGLNLQRWTVIERAKRRLVFGLIALGLTPEPKTGPADTSGLEFHLLEDQPGALQVRTGHDRGVITLNVAEADDDQRESLRVQLGEPVRTLLGHLRHEVAHYLQYRWIDNTPAADECRRVFGDERVDYAAALARHYAAGPPADWHQHHVSAYASAHPWEDWAETCAHYLLVLDAVQTASAWGLSLQGPAPAAPDTLQVAQATNVDQLVLSQWLPVAQFLNAMNRSLGQPDSYPFLLPPQVLDKMGTVQRLLRQVTQQAAAQAGGQGAMAVPSPAPGPAPEPAPAPMPAAQPPAAVAASSVPDGSTMDSATSVSTAAGDAAAANGAQPPTTQPLQPPPQLQPQTQSQPA